MSVVNFYATSQKNFMRSGGVAASSIRDIPTYPAEAKTMIKKHRQLTVESASVFPPTEKKHLLS